jgi:threonine synthase
MTEPAAAIPITRQEAQFRCIGCGAVHAKAEQNFRCPDCGDLLEIIYLKGDDQALNPTDLKDRWLKRRLSQHPLDQSGVWRFRELLPESIDASKVITLREGSTPIYQLSQCARAAGMENLLAKHQGMNPTGSFKDTGMTVAASFAKQQGYRWVACASTGNTSASMAAYAAHGDLLSLVLIPQGKISWGKLSQALDYGAVTCELRTDFDGCMRVLSEVVQRMPIYLLNSVNPYRIEGQKTAAIELMEQLEWQVPDHVIVPGGNLGNSSALGKAFLEMKDLGLIASLPRISIIQAEGANALVRTMRETAGQKLVPVQPETMATAIRIGNPASWKKAVRILEQTGGTVEQVSEIEIAIAKAEIGSDGIGCEPASAVTLAGLKKLVNQGFVKSNESVVLMLTGHLLKDPEFTLKYHRGELFGPEDGGMAKLGHQRRNPIILDATADAVIRTLERTEKSFDR